MKRRDVPRNLGRHRCDQFGCAGQLGFVVVEPGHDQGHDLEPEVPLVDQADGVDDVLEHAAQLAIPRIIHRLEIDLVAIGPRPDVVEHLGRGVAVRDEGGLETRGPRDLEHIDRPFGGDQRLVIRRAHQARAVAQGEGDECVGRHVAGHHAGCLVAQGLGREPVLAIAAMEVAAQHPERQRVAAGEAVEEWLLLGGIALQRGDITRRREERPFLIESDLADAAPAGLHEAAVAAGKAADRARVQFLDQLRFPHTRVECLRQRWRRCGGMQEGGDVARAQRRLPGVS